MHTRAIISDMDGVIADTQSIISQIESDLLRKHGIFLRPSEITERFSGIMATDMFTRIFTDAGRPRQNISALTEERWRRVSTIPDETIVGIPGTLVMLRRWHARGIPLAVASASRPAFIAKVLNALDAAPLFAVTVSTHEVSRGKPAPDVFLAAAARLGVPPQSCVVLEDGISGMRGARAAGMRCVALARGGRRGYPADLVVDDLRDIPDDFL